MRRSIIALILSAMFVCAGCESKPAEPEYNGPATNTPISSAKHARMVLMLKKHVAKYYNSIPLWISYRDLEQLPRLRTFLVSQSFIYRVGSHWHFTKKALAQASEFNSEGAEFPVARGTYDHFDLAQFDGSTEAFAGDTWTVSYYLKSAPANRLGKLFADSHLLICVEGWQHHKLRWGSGGVTTRATVVLRDSDFSIEADMDSATDLNCPETDDR